MGTNADYRPQAIVTVLLSIRGIVEDAAENAGSNAPRYAVPFPGVSHQGRFLAEMKGANSAPASDGLSIQLRHLRRAPADRLEQSFHYQIVVC
jgi:hypothetical protein